MDREDMPLHCTICERKPTFSDISHLLTHISSKQHLSNYFKIQVLSNGDQIAQTMLNRYNSWYKEWNMSQLLKERMDQKEKKKNNNTSQRSTNTASRKDAKITKTSRKSSKQQRKPATQVKTESNAYVYPQIRSNAYGMGYPAHSTTSSLLGWPDDSTYFKTEDGSDSEMDAIGEDEQEFAPPARQTRRSTRRLANISSSYEDSDGAGELQEEDLKESLKLKGVIWPGMLLFDSATPEMQRRRNQKKDTNVVAQLEATSKIVEPNELIFNIAGEFLKQRDINGNTEPDSPLRGETTPEVDTPPAKKRKTRGRRRIPLAERDENSGVVTRRSRRSHTSFGNRKNTVSHEASDDVDSVIKYEGTRKRKREGFSIHRDNSGPDITFNQPLGHDYGMPYSMMGMNNAPINGRYISHRADTPMGAPVTYGMMPEDNPRQGMPYGQFRPASNSSVQDLSAFGQLTNTFQPSYNPFSTVESVQHRSSAYQSNQAYAPPPAGSHPYTSTQRPTAYNGTADPAVGHGHRPWNDPGDQMDTGVFGMYDDMSAFAHHDTVNPLFFGSDQIFPEDVEPLPTVQPKREPEGRSDADTISLASDQK